MLRLCKKFVGAGFSRRGAESRTERPPDFVWPRRLKSAPTFSYSGLWSNDLDAVRLHRPPNRLRKVLQGGHASCSGSMTAGISLIPGKTAHRAPLQLLEPSFSAGRSAEA